MGRPKGWKHSDETKQKMREKRLLNNHRVGTSWTKEQREKLEGPRDKKGVYHPCPQCSNPVYLIPLFLNDGKKHFCGRKCYAESKKGKETWIKGKTKQDTPSIRLMGRRVSESRIKRFDELGISRDRKYPEIWDEVLREKIRNRDGRSCQECGESPDHPVVHHIDWNKENCTDSNLITLCMGCHNGLHASMRKDFWVERLQKKLSERSTS